MYNEIYSAIGGLFKTREIFFKRVPTNIRGYIYAISNIELDEYSIYKHVIISTNFFGINIVFTDSIEDDSIITEIIPGNSESPILIVLPKNLLSDAMDFKSIANLMYRIFKRICDSLVHVTYSASSHQINCYAPYILMIKYIINNYGILEPNIDFYTKCIQGLTDDILFKEEAMESINELTIEDLLDNGFILGLISNRENVITKINKED